VTSNDGCLSPKSSTTLRSSTRRLGVASGGAHDEDGPCADRSWRERQAAWHRPLLPVPSTKELADKAAELLKTDRYRVEVRPAAQGADYLVLASTQASHAGIDAIDAQCEGVARQLGGEFDGREFDVAS